MHTQTNIVRKFGSNVPIFAYLQQIYRDKISDVNYGNASPLLHKALLAAVYTSLMHCLSSF